MEFKMIKKRIKKFFWIGIEIMFLSFTLFFGLYSNILMAIFTLCLAIYSNLQQFRFNIN